MESYEISKVRFIDVFREENIGLFTTGDVRKVFGLEKEDTLKQLLKRLKATGVIKPLLKDKYVFLYSKREILEFETANFLVSPSYISLESALSYYSLIDQFPYRITSLTVGKTREFNVGGKTFVYSKIKPDFFKDFVRVDNFLIATKEKALFDYLYFIYKGLRPSNVLTDLKRYLKNESMQKYFYSMVKDEMFKNFLRKTF